MRISKSLTKSVRRTGAIARRLAFHANGKPRGWVRRVLFRADGRPWRFAHPIIYRRDGSLRPAFKVWEEIYARRLQHGRLPAAARALLTPPDTVDTIAHLLRQPKPAAPVADLSQVVNWLERGPHAAPAPLLLAITHDNYRDNIGGVQVCIRREERSCVERGADYLVVFPWQPLPCLAPIDSDPILSLIFNGTLLGHCRATVLANAIKLTHQRGRAIYVTIHQLLGHRLESVGALIEASGTRSCWLWLHDFFTICPSYTLRRNNVTFCGAPEKHSNSCSLCVYGEERQSHHRRMSEFFARYEIKVVSPSHSALDLWRTRSGLEAASTAVEPHIVLTWQKRASATDIDHGRPMKIAFLGLPIEHKGWPLFERLAQRFDGRGEYEFLSFGITQGSPAIRHVFVGAANGKSQDMVQALIQENIDIVVHWPTTHETFSLTTHEALQSGAYVVTNNLSGNVAATIAELDRGLVLDDEDELSALFDRGAIAKLGVSARIDRATSKVSSQISGLTLRFMAAEF